MKNEKWVQSDFKFDELEIGMKVLYVDVNTESEIINKTTNSIETKNYANEKRNSKVKQEDGKGINCTNWYTLDSFNRTFKRIEVI